MIIGREAIDGLEEAIGWSPFSAVKGAIKTVAKDAYSIGKGAAAARLGVSAGGGGGGGGGAAPSAGPMIAPPPPAKGLSTGAKVGIAAGAIALIFGVVKLGRGRR